MSSPSSIDNYHYNYSGIQVKMVSNNEDKVAPKKRRSSYTSRGGRPAPPRRNPKAPTSSSSRRRPPAPTNNKKAPTTNINSREYKQKTTSKSRQMHKRQLIQEAEEASTNRLEKMAESDRKDRVVSQYEPVLDSISIFKLREELMEQQVAQKRALFLLKVHEKRWLHPHGMESVLA